MAAHRRTETLGSIASSSRRCAQQCNELVPSRMHDQLASAKVGPHQFEDRAKNALRVLLTELFGEPSIVIYVGYEQSNGTSRRAGLGDGSRGRVDEGVVCREPSLLIEKNDELPQAGVTVIAR